MSNRNRSSTVFYRAASARGFLWAEMAVALAVLGIILTGFALSVDGFRRFNHYQQVRQRCIAAASAQLDSIAATGRPISEEAAGELWPKLTVEIDRAAGTGQWQNLELVSVTARGTSLRKQVEVRLSRYMARRATSPADTQGAGEPEGGS